MLDQPVGTFAPDSTKNNNTGTIIGGVTLGEVGPSNTLPKAMGFDGSTGYINTPSELFTDDLILESWVWVSGTNPYTADANCTGLEGVLSYMQNSTMIHSAYNLSKLNKSEPIAEYAAVEGINPSYSTGYKATFESNRGFCRPAISIVVSESSVYRSTYSHGNTTVYFFTISNMSANATEQFGSYLGPKPNITVYMAEAMYGNYIVKAVSAGFSPTTSVGALGLDAYTMNLMNTTLDSFENYIANHQNATK